MIWVPGRALRPYVLPCVQPSSMEGGQEALRVSVSAPATKQPDGSPTSTPQPSALLPMAPVWRGKGRSGCGPGLALVSFRLLND